MRGPIRIALGIVLATATAGAQLADLQPGRNFPTAVEAFGAGRSENVELGDVDRDGDLDVAVANGGDGGGQDNALFLNQGGIQGGIQGTFGDVTATHLAGQVPESSRDVELVDWDGDFDLDLFDASRGSTVVPTVQRAYVNQGGLQLGAIGTYAEVTEGFWGALVSVPLSDELGVQDGFGVFEHPECADADFADLDDDGDLDLLLTSTGPNMNGTEDTRVFLNDGAGRFDELWPWADAAADVRLHTLDMDIVDLDGDFDLDIVASSRDSQSRLYRNNLAQDGWAGDPFTDVTQTVLIDAGLSQSGVFNTYEVEFADVDGDDDFDLWFNNFTGFSERLLLNDGSGQFSTAPFLIQGDPNVDENEIDFLDYDADGDLDAFLANFSGTNSIFQSAAVQGPIAIGGMFHRTGVSGAAPGSETPLSGNGGTSLDSEPADMDGDGDTDIVLVNDGNQNNRYWENVLGVPDTHAPRLVGLSVQGDKSDGSPTPIHLKVMDNESSHTIRDHDVRLVWSVDGGAEVCQPMLGQGGQQFRGVIPGGVTGAVSYRVEAVDSAGNLSVSVTTTYQQSGGQPDPWTPVDCGTLGEHGRPWLELRGSGVGGEAVVLQLVDAAAQQACLLLVSLDGTPAPFKGGLLYPIPWVLELLTATDAGGMLTIPTTWPVGLPVGQATWFQCAIADGVHPSGAALSNAVRGSQP